MGNLGFPELATIAILALLVFGPDRLPELARSTAKFLTRFRAEASKSIQDLKTAADLQDLDEELKAIRGEFSAARNEVTGALREPVDAIKQVSSGGPTAAPTSKALGPPPMDPEAT